MMERVGDRWGKNGRILFDRPKPTLGCSARGGGGGGGRGIIIIIIIIIPVNKAVSTVRYAACILTACFFKTHFTVILLHTPKFCNESLPSCISKPNSLQISFPSCMLHVCSSHPYWFNHFIKSTR
jgi:hypothetical protein